MKHHMRVRKDGVIEWLSPPPGFSIPFLKQTRTRFSEILPVNPFLYAAFRMLRFVFGENIGRIPTWTRTWPCLWRCQILLGPGQGKTRISTDRKELISWEHDRWALNLRNQ